MRRKILQDFVNVFCQRFLQLPNGYDIATLVHLGSGVYELDVLNGYCSYNGTGIEKLKTCVEYKQWLVTQLNKHQIPLDSIQRVSFVINATIGKPNVKISFGHVFASANFGFDCCGEIKTDEKTYSSKMQGEKAWGFGLYYEKLYGSPLALIQQN
jgi:hypothetical protein